MRQKKQFDYLGRVFSCAEFVFGGLRYEEIFYKPCEGYLWGKVLKLTLEARSSTWDSCTNKNMRKTAVRLG
jgi:hypothetical protein